MRSTISLFFKTIFSPFGIALLLIIGSICILLFTADANPTTPETRRLFGLWRLPFFLLFLAGFTCGPAFLTYSKSRNAFLGFVTSGCTIVLLLGALEGLGRAGVIDWDAFLLQSRATTDGVGWAAQPNQEETGETFQDIATRVGLPSDPISFEYSTDKYGFRNPGDAAADIIVLGDSIVLGAQVARSKTVDAVLQKLLDRPVMQVALLGLSIQAQHDLLLTSGIDLSNKTVVQFFFEGNDLLDSASYRAEAAQKGTAAKAAPPSFIRSLWGIAAKATDPTNALESADYCRIAGQPYLFLWQRRSFDGRMDEVSHVQTAIEGFADKVRQAGGSYALVFVPTKFRVLNSLCIFPAESRVADVDAHLSTIPQAMRNWSEEVGIPYLDLTDALTLSAVNQRVPWLWGDTHWAETGHDVAAHALASWEAFLGLNTM
ncbi:alginate O-acetyltransferase AlgX-related protein [Roseovarius sp. Pro17]|uniref:alginate O-acetyltransferase AlgX-related protein n=1 Tax=Roseovarius sp. Pro17 TaxID=3108175 RepID=UPI002D79CD2C|nr:hypothetical protein [Roseovarius sp. Pro17]